MDNSEPLGVVLVSVVLLSSSKRKSLKVTFKRK